MAGSSSALSLDQQASAIEAWARENGLVVVSGAVESGASATTVSWEAGEDAASWRGCLEQAKQLGARFVVVRVLRFSREDLEGAEEESEEEEDEDRDAKRRKGGDYEEYVGRVGAIELRWITPTQPGVVFAWDFTAPWFVTFYGADEDDEVDGTRPTDLSHAQRDRLSTDLANDARYQTLWDSRDRWEAARQILPSEIAEREQHMQSVVWQAEDILKNRIQPAIEQSPEVQELAQRLAHDPRFQRGRNKRQRAYAAVQVVGAEVAKNQMKLQLIIERATTIYEVDLRKGRGPSH